MSGPIRVESDSSTPLKSRDKTRGISWRNAGEANQDKTSNSTRLLTEDSPSDNRHANRSYTIHLQGDHLDDQESALQSEYSLSNEQAEIAFSLFRKLVEEIATRENKNWSDDVIDGVANLIIAMFLQEENQKEKSFQ